MCQKKIDEVLEFSEDIVSSFVEVPAPDNFRNYLFPAAAASSHQTLKNVDEELRSISESGWLHGILVDDPSNNHIFCPASAHHTCPARHRKAFCGL
jgi:hypothetical protein